MRPLAQLVGEKTVKQFLESISTWEYYPQLAFAPVGMVTIIVTALRVARVLWMMGVIGRAEEIELDLVKDVLKCTTGNHGYGAVDSGNLELTIDCSRWCRTIFTIAYDKFPLPLPHFYVHIQYFRELLPPNMFPQLRDAKDVGMISRPDNEMGRSFAAYASTFVLFTGKNGTGSQPYTERSLLMGCSWIPHHVLCCVMLMLCSGM